jgi:hypothetical protein
MATKKNWLPQKAAIEKKFNHHKVFDRNFLINT